MSSGIGVTSIVESKLPADSLGYCLVIGLGWLSTVQAGGWPRKDRPVREMAEDTDRERYRLG